MNDPRLLAMNQKMQEYLLAGCLVPFARRIQKPSCFHLKRRLSSDGWSQGNGSRRHPLSRKEEKARRHDDAAHASR